MSGGNYKSGSFAPNKILTDLTYELKFEELGLVNEKIAPPIKVVEESDEIPVLPRESVAKVPQIQRATDGSFSRGAWVWDGTRYITEEVGHEEEYDTTKAKLQAEYIDHPGITAELAKKGLELGLEGKVATAIFNVNTFAGAAMTNPASDLFNSATTCKAELKVAFSNPAAPVRTVFDAIYKKIMRPKNLINRKFLSLICSDDVVDAILSTTEVVNTFTYTTPVAAMSREQKYQMLSTFLDIKEVVPIAAYYDCAGLAQDAKFDHFWDSSMGMLAKLSSGGQSWQEQALARQPICQKVPYVVETYEEPKRSKVVVRAREYRGLKINTDYGVLITNAY